MRIDQLAIGLAGLTCASCAVLPALPQVAAIAASQLNGSRTRDSFASIGEDGPEKCHPVESVTTSGGKQVPSYGRACEQPDGSWVVTASSVPTDPEDYVPSTVGARYEAWVRAGLIDPRLSAMGPYGYPPGYDPYCAMARRGFVGPGAMGRGIVIFHSPARRR
jgi:hypothetical protein